MTKLSDLLSRHQLPAEVIEHLLEQELELQLAKAPVIVQRPGAPHVWERPLHPHEVACAEFPEGVTIVTGVDLIARNVTTIETCAKHSDESIFQSYEFRGWPAQ